MQPAKFVLHHLVDQSIIDLGRLPTHPSDESYCFHRQSPCCHLESTRLHDGHGRRQTGGYLLWERTRKQPKQDYISQLTTLFLHPLSNVFILFFSGYLQVKNSPCTLTIIWANTTNKRNPIDLADSININTHGYQRRLCTSFSYHAFCGEHNIAGDQP